MSDSDTSRVPLFATMQRIPGGLMLIPLLLGTLVATFVPEALEIGSFTTGLFKDSATPFIALLIFATGTQVTARASGPVLATAGTLLLAKSLIPALLVVLLGQFVGLDGIIGISLLGLLASVDNSNGGLWLAFSGQYGDERDRGAYMASAVNDGPFLTLLFLGASGFGDIPIMDLVAAILPFLLGVLVGNVDAEWRRVMRSVPNIVIPFFAFSLGTDINLGDVVTGGVTGLLIGVIVAPCTGFLVYLGYRFLLRRGSVSGIGFAAGTTAGNAIATPAIVAAADPRFQEYVGTATAQVAASALVTAILAPLLASFALKRAGALRNSNDAVEEQPV